jgi:VWFA-related protein
VFRAGLCRHASVQWPFVLRRLCLSTLIVVPAVGLTAPPQTEQSATSQPVFRTGVDLLPLLVSVLDGSGQPVSGLEPRDFEVTLDGKPRTVKFARFYSSSRTAAPEHLAAVSPAPTPRLAASNTAGNPGRVVVFVVDRESLRAGSGKVVLHTAAKLLSQLTEEDASGFIGLPTGRLEIGRDHERIRKAIENSVGTQRPPTHWRFRIDLREALAFERRDQIAVRDLLERECTQRETDCAARVSEQARELLSTVRTDTRATLQALRQVIGALRDIRAPKLILLLSGGIWFEQESLTEFNLITRQAADARAVVHAVQVDQVLFDVEDRGRGPSPFAGVERQEGLRQVAASTGGAFFQGVGRAEGVFARIASEITSFYEVGIEVLADDIGSAPRTLRVGVNRPGVTVRTRRDIALTPRGVPSGPDTRLRELLGQPVDVPELPISLETYVTRGDQTATLKVILSATIDPAAAASGAAEWGFAVFRQEQQVAIGRDRSETHDPIVTATQVGPGSFRIRFAAIAGDGREGLVEATLPVGLRAHGDVQSSDVIAGVATADRFVPRSAFPAGQEIQALVELYATDTEKFAGVTVTWELYAAPGMQSVRTLQADVKATDAPGRRVCEAALQLPERPGNYVLSAIVRREGTPLGKVSRLLQIQ